MGGAPETDGDEGRRSALWVCEACARVRGLARGTVVAALGLSKSMIDRSSRETVLDDPAQEVRVRALYLLCFRSQVVRETNVQLHGPRVPHAHHTP